jgi:acyl-CoA synthetase (AMP-forming)/AMP-acid ligase II
MICGAGRIDELIAVQVERRPDAVHLILADGSLARYADTASRARRLAGALAERGVKSGDRVVCFMGNSRELYEFFVACSLLGAIGVPLNTLSAAREVDRIAADCEPNAFVVDAQYLDRISSAALAGACCRIVTQGGAPGWLSYDGIVREEPRSGIPAGVRDAAQPAMMIYSSGTTGTPKGILLSQQGIVDNARMTSQVLGYRDTDRFITLLPSFSSFGFSFDFAQAALAGAATVILPQFNPEAAVGLIDRYRVTCVAGVPTMFAKMFDPAALAGRDISSLRLIDVGGGPVAARLKRDLHSVFGVETVESYGLTEISPVASVQIPGGGCQGASCGPPLPGVEVTVVDGEGSPVPAGHAGELLFRCGTLMIGYWGKPELTAETLRGGWLHSGDIGKVDESGNIHILDRLKDVIVTNGYNVYPKEVENVICELDGVQSAAVVGVPQPIRGEDICAFVVPKPAAALAASDILEQCRKFLAKFKVPRSVVVIDQLPLTANGKIRRFELRQRALQAAAQGEEATQ